jgi:cytosine/adenosine deaminase-related metal-dependent hydrolase
MRLAALIHKPRLGPTAMPALRVLEMATVRGAAALGMEDEIGSIEPGKKADIVLLDLRKPHSSPGACVDPVSRVVYSAHSSDVAMTMVDGRVVYGGGQLTNIDENEVLNRCDQAIVRLARRAGIVR